MTDLDRQMLAAWQLLWPLPPHERAERIDAIRADYHYEETLSRVSEAMAQPELVA